MTKITPSFFFAIDMLCTPPYSVDVRRYGAVRPVPTKFDDRTAGTLFILWLALTMRSLELLIHLLEPMPARLLPKARTSFCK